LLEEKFYLNKFHISHVFKEITDFSVIEYVQQRRVIEAQKQLTYSQKKIIDICFDCGFNNIQHFHRVFKKITGVTPHKYRKL
jgi:YesN/AraC family two-component response regulator